jgi:protein SCO1/2
MTALAAVVFAAVGRPAAAASRWGAEYFPNVPLVDQDGTPVRFFDDLIEDRVVAISFVFTHCSDVCPAETARMRQVQKLLGDRVGKDVFFYSISIDPENDTPAVLKAYMEKFRIGPGWRFLTGKQEDITLLRQKLGLLGQEPEEKLSDHNTSVIFGNQATGQWIKRSPYEQPEILAHLVGERLFGGRVSVGGRASYAEADARTQPDKGEHLFRTRCNECHTLDGRDDPNALGPDLLGVVARRDRGWLSRWIREPDVMLKEGDPIARELYARFRNVGMPNLKLTESEASAVIGFIERQSAARAGTHDRHGGTATSDAGS